MLKLFKRGSEKEAPVEAPPVLPPVDELHASEPAEIAPPEVEAPVVEAPAAAPVPAESAFLQEFEPEVSEQPVSEFEAPTDPLDQPAEDEELEEWVEPLQLDSPEPLAADTTLESPFGTLRLERHLGVRGPLNLYAATLISESETAVRVLEEESGAGILARQEQWRRSLDANGRFPMLPALCGSFEHEGRAYLVEADCTGPSSLNALLDNPEPTEADFAEVLLLLVQLAAFLVRLHGAGYAHLGLRPETVVPGKPVQIADNGFVTAIGEALPGPLSFSGYSAPELAHPGHADGRADIYAIGAMLYRAVTGEPVPETGADLSVWQPKFIVAGVPQLLRKCLGPAPSRFSSAEELHQELVRLKNRLRPQVELRVAGASTIGLEPTRTTNQDAFGYSTGAWECDTGPVQWAAFCVADGMGGMAAGEVASEVAVKAFLEAAQSWAAQANPGVLTAADQAALVKTWAQTANQNVVEALDARGARGGCTLDAALVIDKRLCIAHVGDSRLYLIRDGVCEPISRDHSYVMSLVLQGEIKFEDIRGHPDKNKVTRSLGERHPQPDFFVDTLATTQSGPSMDLKAGDILLACSDGLWEPVLENEIAEALAGADLQPAARQLLKLTLERGAPDNATLVLLRVDEYGPVFANKAAGDIL